jgi:hypothetical protein
MYGPSPYHLMTYISTNVAGDCGMISMIPHVLVHIGRNLNKESEQDLLNLTQRSNMILSLVLASTGARVEQLLLPYDHKPSLSIQTLAFSAKTLSFDWCGLSVSSSLVGVPDNSLACHVPILNETYN